MSEEIKIITLGDIFRNIETEEKAFKFKDYIKDLQQKVEQLQQENKQLKDNWNKLKNQEINRFNESQDVQFLDILQDMQELEQGSDSDEI